MSDTENESYLEVQIDLQNLSFETVDLNDLYSKYNELNEDKKRLLYVSEDFLTGLDNTLAASDYVPAFTRRFLCNLGDLDGESELSELRQPLVDRRYISRDERRRALRLLNKWRDVLLAEGRKEDNILFLKNGALTPSFSSWVREHSLSCCKSKGRSTSMVRLSGKMSEVDFRHAIEVFCPNWESYNIQFETADPMQDENSFRFGDAYSPLYTIPCYTTFPLSIQDSFRSFGRGTAGAILKLTSIIPHAAPTTAPSAYYLLTAAHVACSDLAPTYNDNEQQKLHVEALNKVSCNIAYLRDPSESLDYALLPCQPDFSNYCIEVSTGKNPYGISMMRFVSHARQIPPIWREFGENLGQVVVKRGIATGETKGTFVGMTDQNTIGIERREGYENYSLGGDSGALVCLEDDDERALVPLGLHFQGSRGQGGCAIPLWALLSHFCSKNMIQHELQVEFISPSIPGSFTHKPTSTSNPQKGPL